MSFVRVVKNGLMTRFDTDEQGRLMFDGNIFTSVAITEIDRGYRITVTDADHPNGASYDIADNGLIIVASASDIEALSDLEECLILVQNDIVDDGRTFYAGLLHKSGHNITQISRFATTEDVENWNDANAKKHRHQNAEELTKIGEDENGNMTYGEDTLAKQSDLDDAVSEFEDAIAALNTPDTLETLELNMAYDTLLVRSDWADVPVYNTGANEAVAALSDASGDNYLSLMYLTDEVTGMPCPLLQVSIGGVWYNCYGTTYHDIGMVTRQAGWYTLDQMEYIGTAPTMENISFASLIVYNDETPFQTEYNTLENLPADAQCALETLSRIFNTSAANMGGLGTKPDGVQRLTPAPQAGKRYAFATGDDITFPLPQIAWTGEAQEFWLDLDCTSSINLTFDETVYYEDGNNIDTTRGRHRLHFYVSADADMWTVAETESVTEITEDFLPEYVIPFQYCTADQIRAVLKLGYSDGDGNWCVRRKGGVVQTWFSIGDTHPVTLTDGQEVTMRIIGIEHDDLQNGGKAALTCDFKELISIDPFVINNVDVNVKGSYDQLTNTRNRIKSIYNLFPSWIKDIAVKTIKACYQIVSGNQATVGGTVGHIIDYVWPFGKKEVGLTLAAPEDTEYAFFTNNASRIRFNSDQEQSEWILRDTMHQSTVAMPIVSKYGADTDSGFYRSYSLQSVAVGFCLSV